MQNGSLYAFKGLAGRLGPIGVHIALLMVLAGTAYSGFGGLKGSAMCPEVQRSRYCRIRSWLCLCIARNVPIVCYGLSRHCNKRRPA